MDHRSLTSTPFPRNLALQVLGVALATKVGVFLWGALDYPFEAHPQDSLLSIWNRWDAAHYLRIAEAGYSPEGISKGRFGLISHFPPFYPFLVRGLSAVSGTSVLVAGMFISSAMGLLAAYLFARLAWIEFGEPRIVLRSSILFHLYPMSYFLIAPYTESLFFVFLFGFFLFIRRRRNILGASLLLGAAIATRLPGVTIGIPFLLHIFERKNELRFGTFIAAALGPGLVLVGYLFLNKFYWGDPFFFLTHTYEDPTIPRYVIVPFHETWDSLRQLWDSIYNGHVSQWFMETIGWNALFTLFVVGISIFGAAYKLVPAIYSVFALTYIVFYSSFHWGISNARYSYAAFPVFFILSQAKTKFSIWFLVLLFTSGLLYFSKRYVWGYWAF